MANVRILGRDWVRAGTLSGGSWVASLPLTNLKTRPPKEITRSTNALAASTLFVVDIGRTIPVSMFALINHNGSTSGTIRFRLSASAALTSPTIDATINLLTASVVWGSQPWGAFPWNGVDTTLTPPGGWMAFHQNVTTQSGRYIGVDITDTANVAGYLQAGVFLAGESFSPAINMAYGANAGFIDDSVHSRAAGGDLYSDVRPKRRAMSAALEFLTEAEAWGTLYDFQNLLGITGGLLIVYDLDDDDAMQFRRSIYATLTRLDRIVTARTGDADAPTYSWNFEAEELV